MSQHPSLSSSKKHKRHRSVLKRYERLKHMKEKGVWEEDKASIYGLPKIKVLKFRVKKEKVEEVPAEGIEAVAAAGAGAEAQTKEVKGATAQKGATPAKGAKEATPKGAKTAPEAQKGKEKGKEKK